MAKSLTANVKKPKSIKDFVDRYPRILLGIVHAGDLASINQAAVILRDAVEGRKSWSEWVLMRFQGDALQAVRHSTCQTTRQKRKAIPL
jgi:hypothetical protein